MGKRAIKYLDGMEMREVESWREVRVGRTLPLVRLSSLSPRGLAQDGRLVQQGTSGTAKQLVDGLVLAQCVWTGRLSASARGCRAAGVLGTYEYIVVVDGSQGRRRRYMYVRTPYVRVGTDMDHSGPGLHTVMFRSASH